MATTRLMPLHTGKGRTVGQAISDILDYSQNPQKTDNGRLITSWQCDSRIADAEFLFTKNQYIQKTGRVQMGILTVYQQTKNAVGDGSGDPIIVGTTSHYSIGVGYKNITEKQIYTNTGYGYHAWVRANTIISTWTMHID